MGDPSTSSCNRIDARALRSATRATNTRPEAVSVTRPRAATLAIRNSTWARASTSFEARTQVTNSSAARTGVTDGDASTPTPETSTPARSTVSGSADPRARSRRAVSPALGQTATSRRLCAGRRSSTRRAANGSRTPMPSTSNARSNRAGPSSTRSACADPVARDHRSIRPADGRLTPCSTFHTWPRPISRRAASSTCDSPARTRSRRSRSAIVIRLASPAQRRRAPVVEAAPPARPSRGPWPSRPAHSTAPPAAWSAR